MVSHQKKRIMFGILIVWLVLSPITANLLDMNSIPARSDDFVIAEISITSPDDITFENGSLGEEITWNATTADPKNYTITRNSETYRSSSWDGSLLTVNLNHLYSENLTHTLPVTFTFVCTVFNELNESVFDSVEVEVIADDNPPIFENVSYDAEYEVGSFGHTVTWNITETNPDFYNITRTSNETTSNDTIIEFGDWDGSNITINVDGLNASHWYAFTLFLNDTLGHNATNTVNISVYQDLTVPTITSPDDVFYEFGADDNQIIWTVYDSNPANYSLEVLILYNDTTYGNLSTVHAPPGNITQTEWSLTNPKGDNITFIVDDLYLGNYTFTLILFDQFGYNASDSVNVSIYRDERAPVITGLDEFSYEEGYTSYSLNWSAEENNPMFYNLTRDGEQLMNGTWRGENITIVVDGLAVGDYLYNISFTDFFNQSSYLVTTLTVTPDTHNPIVNEVHVLQSYTTVITNNLSVSAYVWDLNNLSSITIEWYVNNETEIQEMNMTAQGSDLYLTAIGEFQHNDVVNYRVIAVDNSSVNLVTTTEWFEYRVSPMRTEGTPAWLWGLTLVVGALASLVLLVLYFRTRTK